MQQEQEQQGARIPDTGNDRQNVQRRYYSKMGKILSACGFCRCACMFGQPVLPGAGEAGDRIWRKDDSFVVH